MRIEDLGMNLCEIYKYFYKFIISFNVHNLTNDIIMINKYLNKLIKYLSRIDVNHTLEELDNNKKKLINSCNISDSQLEQISQLKSKVRNLKLTMRSNKSLIDSLQNEKENLQQELNTIRNKFSISNNKCTDLQNNIIQISSRCSNLENNIQCINNEKADLIADFNGKLNKIQVKTLI